MNDLNMSQNCQNAYFPTRILTMTNKNKSITVSFLFYVIRLNFVALDPSNLSILFSSLPFPSVSWIPRSHVSSPCTPVGHIGQRGPVPV